MAERKDLAQEHTTLAVRMIEDLGFVVNRKKSCLVRSKETVFLGFQIWTLDCVLRLPMEKVKKIRREVRRALESE